ncbi:uncharacterized protein EV420DRAFT_1634180 [Desarmillaria tabescens]|uniref:Uncharacterized protein n=1 Tax=Armillaria tabescens TaxID=1929756 RepID=A0AA39NQD2_ARMTA|nr:uncharacterized protein EV420DRAFT_1634180 [Desarmillaria tabescens]KAK0469760.1 hypothetical protein EV420DRAFT_1634180 [Desarmillaria tabescens]
MGSVPRPKHTWRPQVHVSPPASHHPRSPSIDREYIERAEAPVYIKVYSPTTECWEKFSVDCLKASDPFDRDIIKSLLACRMDSPGKHPPPWVNRTDGSSQIAHMWYSSDLNIQPYFRERSVLVTGVPTDRRNWGWNACTAWELGDLDTEIPVHEPVRRVTDATPDSVLPTVEISSTLRMVL